MTILRCAPNCRATWRARQKAVRMVLREMRGVEQGGGAHAAKNSPVDCFLARGLVFPSAPP